MDNYERIHQRFVECFGTDGALYTAPGRINLIGEHTDYNEGFVFPGAVQQSIVAEVRPNATRKVNLVAIDLELSASFDLDDEAPQSSHLCYVYGVARELMRRGVAVRGFDAVYGGDVPLGAGMSSSAALECCFAVALNACFQGGITDRMELARVGQDTEHHFVGVNCGIMDQFISMHGKAGHLVRLDCRSGEYSYFPWQPHGYRLVLVNSCVKHALVGSPYNDRRHSCEHVAEVVGLPSLRECSWQQLEAVKSQVSAVDYSRARYVLGERDRVLTVCDALERADYETVGTQMYQTHWGLSRDYEVSCDELDFLVDTAQRMGVTGSRLMGGGFGGCSINLVKDSLYDTFTTQIHQAYLDKFQRECQIIPIVIGDGARRVREI